jgi:hypothetical protein
MSVNIKLPVAVVEPLFTALHNIKPNSLNKLEMKSIQLLKSSIYFELERMMEDGLEKRERDINFKTIFHEERMKRLRERTY